MAGLLSRLQKDRPKDARTAREAVIRDADAGVRMGGDEIGWGGGIDPVGEPNAGTRSLAQPAMGVKKLAPDSTTPPPWMKDGHKLSPQVETVVLGAVSELASTFASLLTDPAVDVALEAVVARAAAAVDGDVRITVKHRELAVQQLRGLLLGYGPLTPLFHDHAVSEVFVDSHRSVKVLRGGTSIETPFKFRSADEYLLFVNSLLVRCGATLNRDTPIAEVVLGEGAKIFLQILDPSIVDGVEPRLCFTIPRVQQISFFDLLQTKTLPALVAAWLTELVASREANVLVCAPARAGKSVFLNALLSAVPTDERVVVVEAKPELSLPTTHVERLLANGLASTEGCGVAELIRAGVRKHPHRMVLGELSERGATAYLEALEAGLSGSLASIMAASAQEALAAFADLAAASAHSNRESIARRVARTTSLVIVLRRNSGTPYVESIGEVVGVDAGQFFIRPLVRYAGEVAGKRQWRLETRRSVWLDRMKERGSVLRPGPGLLYEAPPTEEKGS